MTIGRFCLCLLLATCLAACAGAPAPPPKFADIRFTQEPPLRLNVARLELIERFQPSFQAPEVEHEFAVPPQQGLANLFKDRLQAVAPASGAVARFTIEDASVRETALPRTPGIEGAFTIDQAERYDGRVAVKLVIYDASGLAVRTARVEATASRSVPENITLNDRDRSWYEMSQELVRSLDRKLEQQVDESFFPYKG
jgi:hypothetical protein